MLSVSLVKILAWQEEYYQAVFNFCSALVTHQAMWAQLEVATATVQSFNACQHFTFRHYSKIMGLELAAELDPSAIEVPLKDKGKDKGHMTSSNDGDGGDSDNDVVSHVLRGDDVDGDLWMF